TPGDHAGAHRRHLDDACHQGRRDHLPHRAPSATVPAAPAVPPGVTYAISVSGAVSATTVITTFQGEGPWLARAHAATQRRNADYDVPEPARLALRYAWNDREESLARGLLRGIAAFFHVPLPPWALRPRDAPVDLDAVVPPG